MPTAAKIATVAELTEKLQRSTATVVLHYRELKVSEISELRRKLRANGMDIELRVAKNTLLRIAARDAGKTDLDGLFTGPTAVAFIYGSEPQGAKAVMDAVRAVRKDNVKVTGGTLGTRALDIDAMQRLTTMLARGAACQVAGNPASIGQSTRGYAQRRRPTIGLHPDGAAREITGGSGLIHR